MQGEELISALSVLPEYHDNVRNENQAVRMMELSAIQRIYVPSEMSIEIYSKMYLALVRSLQKKSTNIAIKQRYENYKAIQQHGYIQPSVIQNKSTTRKKKTIADLNINQTNDSQKQENYSIAAIAEKAKTENIDVVALLKTVYKVVEVAI